MQVFVKILTGDAITLDVSPSDTIAELRSLIEASNGIHPDRQKLMFDKKELLDDSCTLEKSSIGDQAAIFLFKKPMQITVLLPEDKFISLDVEELTTIGSIKSKLEETRGVPVIYQRLFFNDAELRDFQTVQHLTLKHNSTLYFVPMESITLSVVTPDGNVLRLPRVPLKATVVQLNHKISQISQISLYPGNISNQKLYYGRTVLPALRTLYDIGLPNGSTLYLIHCPDHIWNINLYLSNEVDRPRTYTGMIEVDDTTTTLELKNQIVNNPKQYFYGQSLNVSTGDLTRVIQGRHVPLKDEGTLKESGLRQGSTIYCKYATHQ